VAHAFEGFANPWARDLGIEHKPHLLLRPQTHRKRPSLRRHFFTAFGNTP
jgi:hypothetical protein